MELLVREFYSLPNYPERLSSVQSLSRVQLFVTPMDCSMPCFPVHHQLPELVQTHVACIGDAIQPSHPLPPPSPLPSIFPSIRVFSNELAVRIRLLTYWSFSFSVSPSNEYSGLISFRIDWFDFLAVQGTLKSSPTPCFKSINSLALSFPYSPTLTSIHDCWKSLSFDYVELCQ